jgi:hypothetical protein
MLKTGRLVFLRSFLVCYAGLSGVHAIAAPNFTIAATNVTMPEGGNPGRSSFTLTAGSGYSGLVTVDCDYTGAEVPAGAEVTAKVPTCWIFSYPNFDLESNQTVKGTLTLVPYGKKAGDDGPVTSLRSAPALVVGLVGVVAMGWRLNGKARSFLALIALGFIAVSCLTSCARGLSGTFHYTITAVDNKTKATSNASFYVTVP